MNRLIVTFVVVLLLSLSGVAGPSLAAAVAPDIVRIGAGGTLVGDSGMVTAIFRPAGEGPFPVVVYSHGRSGTEFERSSTRVPDAASHVRYWVKKGFAVVAPIRPGYGETGGDDREASGVRYDIFGNCWGQPEFERAAAAASDAVTATLSWLRQQPWADRNRIVLVGASMGGLASVASAAKNPDGVIAYINFSGGTGGNGRRSPEHSCGARDMQELMAAYGATARVSGLWLYAKNDSFWGARWPHAWHRAFAAGGSRARFVMTDPVPNADGHQLLGRGSRLWTVHVDQFLIELGLAGS